MTHRYTAASDGWLAFITPARQLFVAGNPDAAIIDRLWTRIRDERGPAGVLETLAANGLFSTPPFAFIELGDGGVDVIVRGDAVVRAGAEQVSGSDAATWIEHRLPGGSVGVTLAGSGSLELPIEAGVVRAAAFATGTAQPRQAAAATPAAANLAAVTPPATPEPVYVDVPPDATIPLAQFIAEEEARTRAAQGQTAVSEETVVELPDAAAPPMAAPTGEPAASDPGSAEAGPASADGYDYLFGETVYHSVQDAAVRTEAPPEEETERPAEQQPVEGDHDGSTVLASSITRTGRQRRPRGKAAAATAPAIAVVLPTGAREPLEEALVLGRSPSVSGVPGGQLPRLVTLSSGDQDISRSHVRIALEGGTVVVTDLHSRNGTTIVLPSGETQKLRGGEPTPVILGTVVDLGGGVELRLEEL